MRIKRGTLHSKRKRNIRKAVKGFQGRRKNLWRTSMEAYRKSLVHAYTGRKRKKREFRRLWIIRINALCRELGVTYSTFMHQLKTKGISLDRKVLAYMAVNDKEGFAQLVEKTKP